MKSNLHGMKGPIFAALAALIIGAPNTRVEAAPPLIGINTFFADSDWSTDNLFADAMKTSRCWQSNTGGGQFNASQVDSNGWPLTDGQIAVWAGNPSNMSGAYALSFNGQATVTAPGGHATISNQVYNSGTNTTTASVTVPDDGQSGTVLLMQWANTIRTFGGAANTGVTNVQLMRPTTVNGTASYAFGTHFSTPPKTFYANFNVIRPLQMLEAWGNPAVNWSDRTVPGWASQQRPQVTGQFGTAPLMGAAYEYAVALANDTNRDIWINTPVGATDDYMTKLAQLVRYGTDGHNPYTSTQSNPVWPPLAAGLHLYIEYGNEIWNTAGGVGFAGWTINHNATTAEVASYPVVNGKPLGPLTFDGVTNDGDWRRSAKRTVEVSNIFRTVFGDSAMPPNANPRVRPVMEAQEDWQDGDNMSQAHMFQDYYNNQATLNAVPSSVTVAHPPNYYVVGGGGSTYADSKAPFDINTIWTSGTFDPAAFATTFQQPQANYALPIYGSRIAYEGAPELPTSNDGYDTVRAAARSDSRMTQLIEDHQRTFNQNGGGLLVYYCDNSNNYEWGMVQDMNVQNTPSMAAITAINAGTQAVGTYGTAIPSTIAASGYKSPASWSGINPSNMIASGSPQTGNWTWTGYVVCNAAAGSFNFALSAGSSGAGNQADIVVDGTVAGTITIPNTGSNTTFSNTSTVNVANLAAGTHGLLVKAKAGSFGFASILVTVGSPAPPPAPTGLTATAGNAQVSLTWAASGGATSYNVLRSTVSGSGYASVATGITVTNYTNTGLTNGTAYYFVVTAANAGGTSGNSNQASATPSGGTSGLVKINAGGPSASPFAADIDFSGGTAATNWTGAINTSAVTNPAPQAVYQSERYGAMTYTMGGLTPSTNYTVRLHFCENYWSASGQRTFTVAVNNTNVLTNFDIFAAAGAQHKANIQQFTAAANGSGQIVIAFTNIVDHALVNGIEVNALTSPPPAPTGLTATAGDGQVALSWTASTGATTYNVLRSTVNGSGYASAATGIAVTNYTNTGLTNGTAYYFVVTAANAGGTSGNSNQASATPTAGVNLLANPGFETGVISPWAGGGAYGITTTAPPHRNLVRQRERLVERLRAD